MFDINHVSLPIMPDFKIPERSLEDQKALALTAIKNAHSTNLLRLIGNPSQVDIATYAPKKAVAEKVLAGTATPDDVKIFEGEAANDGLSLEDFAKKVIAKSNKYFELIGVAGEIKSEAEKAVKTAATNEEIDAALSAAFSKIENYLKTGKVGSVSNAPT